MANGCVRVYSGLMDMMTDDEVRGVLGHELGHVALGHTKNKMQVAYTAMAARGALAASGNGAAAALSNSQLGELGEARSTRSSRRRRKARPTITPSTC